MEYSKIRVSEVKGRYLNYLHIDEFLSKISKAFKLEVIGTSVNENFIKKITFGSGPIKILMWSQMHGNESTTTKAVIDFLNYLSVDTVKAKKISNSFSLSIIPILNPDGAIAYTRVNANGIDLNRDAQDLSQPESVVLRNLFEEFNPDYCFNLHDQRTIFNVGNTDKPATVSFLAPAFDKDRNNSPSRIKSMQVIAAMNSSLQELIPGQVGRYDDGFNNNCVGDAFQMEEKPTILFEAGHYPEDYQREKTRELIWHALIKSLDVLMNEELSNFSIEDYLNIPENSKQYVDLIITNTDQVSSKWKQNEHLYVQFKEVLDENIICFKAEIIEQNKENLEIFGHKELDCANNEHVEWMKTNDVWDLLF